MKNLSTFFGLFLCLSIVLFSCSSSDDTPEPPEEEQLPPNTVTIEDNQATYTFAYIVLAGNVEIIPNVGFTSWVVLLSNYDLEELVDEEFNFTDPGEDFSGYYAQIVAPLNSNVNGLYDVEDVDLENIDSMTALQYLGRRIAPDVEFGFDFREEDFETVYTVVDGTINVGFSNNVLVLENDLITNQGLEIKFDFEGPATFLDIDDFLDPDGRTIKAISLKFPEAFKQIQKLR